MTAFSKIPKFNWDSAMELSISQVSAMRLIIVSRGMRSAGTVGSGVCLQLQNAKDTMPIMMNNNFFMLAKIRIYYFSSLNLCYKFSLQSYKKSQKCDLYYFLYIYRLYEKTADVVQKYL